MRRRVIHSTRALHTRILEFWKREERKKEEANLRIPNRFEQLEQHLLTRVERQGDELVARIKDVFHHGMGVKWGDDQIRVFQAFLASCLPLVYGKTWADEKARVLKEWNLERECMFSLVNMARRNGKTFVTSGTAAALLLCVPNIKIAIFSTCKRTSQMMMEAIMDMLEKAFNKGTHVSREDYIQVTKNMESVCYEGPDKTKRILGSFPGSVRVSFREGRGESKPVAKHPLWRSPKRAFLPPPQGTNPTTFLPHNGPLNGAGIAPSGICSGGAFSAKTGNKKFTRK